MYFIFWLFLIYLASKSNNGEQFTSDLGFANSKTLYTLGAGTLLASVWSSDFSFYKVS
ncbi:hypothetical protein [Francisella philomiragia]|uniref:hypothetical protein n=1 Tax=Francisella philomiragia TaxID=28110 RepID=UPI0019032251|nr:hypothetical protein [Francisella philomiragia]MBK2267749.1 hypothetical protein [Francisella philomiragia]MBK2279153.1 hypothetical protein [Francisella philomiragia]MBK2287058.1 hypothetical protein [Francisella philomiragia]MBK2288985.1 hypothetical protein [Francisella philomiragia]MBK2290703.1 hypothetical protein [Francisella philomiragia]